MMHSASAEGFYYGNSELEYRNLYGTPRFFTNWNSGNGYFYGNLGVGTINPGSKLHIVNRSSGYNSNYFPGAIIEGNGITYLSFLVPNNRKSAVFYGKAFDATSGGIVYNNANTPSGLQFRANGNTKQMAITNTGNVGIVTLTPAFPLSFPDLLGEKISLWGKAASIMVLEFKAGYYKCIQLLLLMISHLLMAAADHSLKMSG